VFVTKAINLRLRRLSISITKYKVNLEMMVQSTWVSGWVMPETGVRDGCYLL
jgi:hypothetical protein